MNIKYSYPYPKICVICHETFLCKNRYQARKNKLCFNPDCKRKFMSRLQKGKTISPEHRKAVSAKLKGRIFSAEHRRKLSLSSKGNTSNLGKKFTLEHRHRLSEAAISRTHYTHQDTSIERKIRKALREMKLKFEKQYVVTKITKTDFYVPSLNLIIMCDGDYWHNLPGRKEKDEQKTKAMLNRGYKVLRLTEKEINSNLEKCKEAILSIDKNR